MGVLVSLLLTLTLAPDPTTVSLDDNGWIAATADDAPSTWSWSATCAPQKITAGSSPDCRPTRRLDIRAAANASVLWATAGMLRDLPDDRLPRSTANEAGLASLAAPAGEDIWIRALAGKTATPWTRVASGTDQVRLTPAPAVPVRITLAPEDAKPMRRARIALLATDCQRFCPDRFLAFAERGEPVTITAMRGVAYQLVVWSDSHAPLARTFTATDRDVSLALQPGGTLSARLVDAERVPLRGGTMEVRYRLPGLTEVVRRAARTGTDGTVALTGLPASLVEWSADAPTASRRVDQASLPGGTATSLGEIVLHPARSADVLVRDGAGAAIANAKVTARGTSFASTDAKGFARLSDLPQGDVALEITANGFLPSQATLRNDAREPLAITLARGAAVEVTLLRQSDGQAPRTARVRITNNGRQTLRTIDVSSGFHLSGLRGGTARLSIHADGAQSYDTGTLQLIEGEVTNLGIITLPAGLALRGTVIGDDAAPVSGARIRLLHTDGDSPALSHVLGNWIETESSTDGTFSLEGLKAGAHLVVVDARGFAGRVLPNLSLSEREPGLDAGTVVLERGHIIELTCRPEKRCGTEASILTAGPDYPFLAIRTSLQNGRGTFNAVPSGTATLRLTRNQHVIHEQHVNIPSQHQRSALEVELPAVRVHGDVVIGGRRAQQGSLLFTRSVRSSGVPIMINGSTDRGTTIDKQWLGSFGASASCAIQSNGEFSLEELEPGTYDVVFRANGASTTKVAVTIPNAAEHRVALQFAGAEIAGRVIDATDQPASVRIEVVDASGASHVTSSDIDGGFRLLGLTEGRARVTAAGARKKAVVSVETDDAEARALLLRLADDPAAGLTVDVRDATGKPAAGVLVFALADSGVLAGSTDRDGRASLPAASGGPVRLAAHQPGGPWAFGSGQPGETAQLFLPARPGAMVANSISGAGEASIVAPNGFPLERVLPMVGISSRITSGSSLRLAGLPPGSYDLSFGLFRKGVTVSAGSVSEVRFGD